MKMPQGNYTVPTTDAILAGWLRGLTPENFERFRADDREAHTHLHFATAYREWSGFYFHSLRGATNWGGDPDGSGRVRYQLLAGIHRVPWGENGRFAEWRGSLDGLVSEIERQYRDCATMPYELKPGFTVNGEATCSYLQLQWLGMRKLTDDCDQTLDRFGVLDEFNSVLSDGDRFGFDMAGSQMAAIGGIVSEVATIAAFRTAVEPKGWLVKKVEREYERNGVDFLMANADKTAAVSIKSGSAFGLGTIREERIKRHRTTPSIYLEAKGMHDWANAGSIAIDDQWWLDGCRWISYVGGTEKRGRNLAKTL